ncbi:MAG: tRNA (adenosine(37)-N6)-threonylcarbamoyltransferase complex dimerization subunit type 1 TsaB [Omnitrophica bacterium GWA2_52_8]|nr:MAG: tRNA (adenosine(37)-N6)-threonylcarbamoyltransferase complex dimerization subunit type 1 TsaB [Omnitrophica bacterium GWA2_52_8]
MATLLALDTSSQLLSAAVKPSGGRIDEEIFADGPAHSENLLPVIDKLLARNRLKLSDIDCFLIGRGPGSFTGLRVGFATLKGFWAAEKKDCYGVLGPDMIAARCKLAEGSLLGTCLDAYRQRLYVRFYRRKNESWIAEQDLKIWQLEELTTHLKNLEAAGKNISLTGDGLKRYGAELKQSAAGAHQLAEDHWYPRASVMIENFELWRSGPRQPGSAAGLFQKLESPEDFIPLYFRLSEAEEKKGLHVQSR